MTTPDGQWRFHPAADLLPLMSDDEIEVLADDILRNGQHQPIKRLDGAILDGRNRTLACGIAGVKPVFEEYDGDDPFGYVMSVNLPRRHMSKGQRAVVIAQMCLVSKQSTRDAGDQYGISAARISQANTVIHHAAEFVESVKSGALQLDWAYEQAKTRKAQAEEAERLMAELRSEAPGFAELVGDGELTAKEAHKKWKEEEALKQRQARDAARNATQNLCDHIPYLAQWLGDIITRYATLYNPGDAFHKRIDRKMIADARASLDEIDRVFQERGLP